MERLRLVTISLMTITMALSAQEVSLHLTFDDFEGDVAFDSSGNGNDATFTGGVALIDGPFGQALEFDGGSSGQIPDHPSLDITTAITVSFWALVHVGEAIQSGLEKGPAWAAGEYNLAAAYNICKIVPEACNDDNIGPSIQDGNWHFLAGTWDGDMITLYIDGEVEAEMPCEGELSPNNQPLFIGARAGNQRFLNGALDEVRLYTVALTEEEIQRDMGETVTLPVEASGKLATMWGELRAGAR